MAKFEYLTMAQITILLKCYYLRKYTVVAESEDRTVGNVKRMKENAFRTIRLAYSKSHMQGLRFEGAAVLEYMAERSGMETVALSNLFDRYIADGLSSKNGRFWQRIRRKGSVPTAAELLDFLYDKFEVEIEGGIQ